MLFFYILGTLILLTWILLPLFSPKQAQAGDALLQERILSLETTLKNLYSDGHKKISDDDFSHIEHRLLISLAKLYHQAGLSPEQVAETASEPAPQPTAVEGPEAEEKPAPTSAAKPTGYCGKCGHAVNQDFAFCPQCGRQLNAA